MSRASVIQNRMNLHMYVYPLRRHSHRAHFPTRDPNRGPSPTNRNPNCLPGPALQLHRDEIQRHLDPPRPYPTDLNLSSRQSTLHILAQALHSLAQRWSDGAIALSLDWSWLCWLQLLLLLKEPRVQVFFLSSSCTVCTRFFIFFNFFQFVFQFFLFHFSNVGEFL